MRALRCERYVPEYPMRPNLRKHKCTMYTYVMAIFTLRLDFLEPVDKSIQRKGKGGKHESRMRRGTTIA
jgi:hypothetical protein